MTSETRPITIDELNDLVTVFCQPTNQNEASSSAAIGSASSDTSLLTVLLRALGASEGFENASEISDSNNNWNVCNNLKQILLEVSATINPLTLAVAAETATPQRGMQLEHGIFLLAATVIFVVGLCGNLLILASVLRTGILKIQIRLLLLCLSIADTAAILVEFPTQQLVWLVEYHWTLGNAACRIMAFLRAHCFYLIAYILVVISLDRYLNVRAPLNINKAYNRTVNCVLAAWILSVVLAFPQPFLFSVREHLGVQQCVQVGLGDDPSQQSVYAVFTFCLLYLIPVTIIALTYMMTNAIVKATTHTVASNRSSTCSQVSSRAGLFVSSVYNGRKGSIIPAKNKTKALRTCLYTVVCFVVCWGPYMILQLLYAVLGFSFPYEVFKLAELLAVSNACTNPFVFGNYILHFTRQGLLRMVLRRKRPIMTANRATFATNQLN